MGAGVGVGVGVEVGVEVEVGFLGAASHPINQLACI